MLTILFIFSYPSLGFGAIIKEYLSFTDIPMIQISKKEHKGEWQIFLHFDYQAEIAEILKKMEGIRYSNTQKAWYLPYTKPAWHAFLKTGLSYQISEFGTTGLNTPLSENTETTQTDMPSQCNHEAADKIELNIRYKHPYLLITGRLTVEEIAKLKSLPKTYWNVRYKNWVVEAKVNHLEFLHQELNFISQNQFEIWKTQIAAVENPPKCMLYKSPEYPDQILLQLSGIGVDVDFVKYIPERKYHSDKKFWVLPYDDKLIERITDHYTALKTLVINKIQSENVKAKTINYKELRGYLLNKTPEVLLPFAIDYLNVLMRERYSNNTLKEYHGKFMQFAKAMLPKMCDTITEDEVNDYITQISQEKVSESLINTTINAIKFYYQKVIYLPEFKIERIRRPRKAMLLPKVLSVEEVDRMLRATENLKHTTLLYALYGHGLRLNEVLHLRLEDIMWERNQLFIKAGKGKKDRYITMSQEFKLILSTYAHEYKPRHWLFEGHDQVSQYSERSVQQVVKQAAQKAKINKRVTPHTLRHCYATHLVDAGTQLPYIKELLGHKDIKTTMIYTHITTASIEKVISPLDMLKRKSENYEKPQ